ncbi:hypothetical protein GA0115242_118864 [Streptomyces sp. SolWspMP-5a-2]|nr:hypothetical protein GA0115242_118864 [Streptomyces sp. SolWspMP-5a-2]
MHAFPGVLFCSVRLQEARKGGTLQQGPLSVAWHERLRGIERVVSSGACINWP